ncbi:MAG: Trm112 family protein [Gammaproteobacteria bacterium]
MDEKLLDIICCPQTRQPLELLDAEQLGHLNQRIAAGSVRNHGEEPVQGSLSEALVTADGRLVYPIREGIPILLEDECIDWVRVSE